MATKKPEGTSKSKMVLKKESRLTPTTLDDIPDKLLELVLLHLSSSLWLIHAAATCRRWRRIITSRQFLGVLHRRHPSQLAGYYYPPPLSGGSPTFAPSSAAINIASPYFSLDFLPGPARCSSRSWKLTDTRGSLVLLTKRKGGWMRRCFPDLVVCEPLTGRYRLIPRPMKMKRHECLGVFLHGNGNGLEDFVVTCVLYECYMGVSCDVGTSMACVFGRGRSGRWYWSRSPSPAKGGLQLVLQGKDSLQIIGHDSEASFWWIKDRTPMLLVWAHWSGSFWIDTLPEQIQSLCIDESTFRFVKGLPDCEICVACLHGHTLMVFARQYRYGYDIRDSEWMLEKRLNLSEATLGLPGRKAEYFGAKLAKIVTVIGRRLVLTPGEEMWPFSVDIHTIRIERWDTTRSMSYAAPYPYELPWPPRFNACLCPCRRRRQGPCYEICNC